MKKTSKQPVIYAFIDSQNINLAIQDQGWKLDFQRFRIYLKDKYKVKKAFLFIGYVAGNEVLYAYLQNSGYMVIFKPTLAIKRKASVLIKGNVDAELVLHAMIEYKSYNGAIIVSGDGDFHCLVEYLKNNDKLERLIIPNRKKFSRLLWKFRKNIDFMNNLKSKLVKK
ncbi:NYN domain-containing protein [Patescibacteria group bacterium]|nr:NYN domain-containing protein [Patescibacteria group bacterium]MBU1931798.1 NYN domain-containing protein [Patescibacteria group bacterium]